MLIVLAREVTDLPSGGWALDPDGAVLRRSVHTRDAVHPVARSSALLMLIHLADTDIGLGSCLVGTCACHRPRTGQNGSVQPLIQHDSPSANSVARTYWFWCRHPSDTMIKLSCRVQITAG
jgi:hypothetical protein